MALIDLEYKGLTGALNTLTDVDDTDTIDELITAIAADEGLDTNYYQISKEGNPTDTFSVTYGDSSTTLADLGIEDGDRIICTTNQHGTKEQRQKQKLDIAQTKRRAGGDTTKTFYRSLNTYDIGRLPNPYEDNEYNFDDDENTGVLLEGRPWNVIGTSDAYLITEDGNNLIAENNDRITVE